MSPNSSPGDGKHIERLPDLVVPFKRATYERVVREFRHFARV